MSPTPSWAEVSQLAQFVEEQLRQLVQRADGTPDATDVAQIVRLLHQQAMLKGLSDTVSAQARAADVATRDAVNDEARRRRIWQVLILMADEFRDDSAWSPSWTLDS